MAWYTAYIASQITYVTLADGRQQERKIPLLFRMALPLAPNVIPLLKKKLFNKIRIATDKRLAAAGLDSVLTGNNLLALQILLPPTMGLLWILFIKLAIASSHNPWLMKIETFLYILGPTLLFIYPQVWLKDQLKKRHRSIQRSLPFVLDLLTLSVEAGMDFMSALQRNVERAKLDPLSEELLRVIREIQLGKTRKE
jgi:tight adherence protein C